MLSITGINTFINEVSQYKTNKFCKTLTLFFFGEKVTERRDCRFFKTMKKLLIFASKSSCFVQHKRGA